MPSKILTSNNVYSYNVYKLNFSNLVEGYKLGYIGISSIIAFCIVTLLIFIWG